MSESAARIDATDRRLILATQAGLPLTSRPFAAVADQLGIDETEVLERFSRLKAAGVVRRIAAVPNHYAVGYRANAMTVWDVPDDRIDAVGTRVGALDFVSHCYRRPRHLPVWRYNLFAMVHGRDRGEAERRIAELRAVIGEDAKAHDVLWSRRILKKTGLRLRETAAVGS
ncbi:MAG TPA: AsnC family transcriptional regulator [Candidatus Binatia bacterium]|nr:AsnC family transcriptional regulator [Candidatus Binatia bacterium]